MRGRDTGDTCMRYLHVKPACDTCMWLLHVTPACDTCMWHLHVTPVCDTCMWHLWHCDTCMWHRWHLYATPACDPCDTVTPACDTCMWHRWHPPNLPVSGRQAPQLLDSDWQQHGRIRLEQWDEFEEGDAEMGHAHNGHARQVLIRKIWKHRDRAKIQECTRGVERRKECSQR